MTFNNLKIRLNKGAFSKDDRGVVTMEFVVLFPFVLSIIFWICEMGFMTARYSMLQRAVDLTVRDLRLQAITAGMNSEEAHDELKDRICENSYALANCRETLRLELTAHTTGGGLPTSNASCVDRTEDVQPDTVIITGTRAEANIDEIVYMRACAVVDPIYPADSFFALPLAYDSSGGYRLVVDTVYINEPF